MELSGSITIWSTAKSKRGRQVPALGINTGHYWLGRLCQQMQSYHVWYTMNSLFYWPCVCRIYWRRKWGMFLEGFRKSIAASWRIEQKREKANEQRDLGEDWKSIFMWLQMQEVALERGKCGGEWTGKSGAPVAPRQQGGGDPKGPTPGSSQRFNHEKY